MEYLNTISNFLVIPFICFIITFIFSNLLYNREKKCFYPDKGWMNINEYPIPEDIRDFLATDGKEVSHMYMINYNSQGKARFNIYKESYITHWQPLPSPPKE